ncbi:hypothetical protein KDL45_17600, partial [bacterium]|nr:hypothetical protein [bacterium]
MIRWPAMAIFLALSIIFVFGASCGDDDDDTSDDDSVDDDDDTADDDTADDDTDVDPPFETCVEAMTWFANEDMGCGIVWHDDG